MKLILTIDNGVELYASDDLSAGSFIGPANVDGDGSGPSYCDPCFQSDTSLHYKGKPINSNIVPGVVLPRRVIMAFPGIVIGCKARVINQLNGIATDAVVYDVGPPSKLGEYSIACIRNIGIPCSPVTGGEQRHVVACQFWPGVPGIVHGIEYDLQPSK